MQDMIDGRCGWCGTDGLYVKYHDEEWGRPVTDDGKLFEFLVLESAQAALAWQQTLLDTAQTRYDLGLTTCSAVLDAQDEVASAQSALDSAWRDLFSACNSYRWAVEYGLLPAQGA